MDILFSPKMADDRKPCFELVSKIKSNLSCCSNVGTQIYVYRFVSLSGETHN